MKEVIVELRKVWFSYDSSHLLQTAVLQDVSLTIREGESICVVGASGCGKTTLGYICAGLLEPTKGFVSIGRPAVRVSRASPVQMIFQDPYASINPRRTVHDWFGLARGVPDHSRLFRRTSNQETCDINQALDMVGLPESVLGRYPGQLSGGQLQRVSIAAALLTSPRCMILDEPISMLDERASHAVLETVSHLITSTSISVMWIAHDSAESGLNFDKSYHISNRRFVAT